MSDSKLAVGSVWLSALRISGYAYCVRFKTYCLFG